MQGYYIDNGGVPNTYAPQGLFGSIAGSIAGEAIGKRFGHPGLGGIIGGAAGSFLPFQAPVMGAPVAYAPSPAVPRGFVPMATPAPVVPVAGGQGLYQPMGIGSALWGIAKPILAEEGKKLVRRHAPSVMKKAKRWGKKLFGFQAHPYAPVQYAEIDVEIDDEGNELLPMGLAPDQFAQPQQFQPQQFQPMGLAQPGTGEFVPMAGPIGTTIARWAPIVSGGVDLIGKLAEYSPWSVQPGYPMAQPASVAFQGTVPAVASAYPAPAYA